MILLTQILDELEGSNGPPAPPETDDPFEMILWENVVYLADDKTRRQAFEALGERVGTTPAQVLAVPFETLVEIAARGPFAEQRADRMRQVAQIALDRFNGDLMAAARLPFRSARTVMEQFPGVGDPGADKILLFSASHACFAFESNGLRVLLRLGFGKESANYSASYRSALAAIAEQLEPDFEVCMRAYQLLRRHGQTTCKASSPRCGECGITALCSYYARS